MGNVLVNEASLQAIADAIRVKNGSTDKYLPSEMPSAIEWIQSGGESPLIYAKTVASMFKNATFPEGYILDLNLPTIEANGNRDISYAFQNTKGVKKICLRCNTTSSTISASYAFGGTQAEEIDLSEFSPIIKTNGNMFASASNLRSIKGELDFSQAPSITAFANCTALVDVEFKKESIFRNLPISASPNLSEASVQSIIDALANDGESHVINLHKTVKEKLTEAQISQITSKNWTLA